MDNPQRKTEEVLAVLDKYNYSVDSLQVLAWTELNELRQGREFTEKHKENIRHKKLTKLEEVGYVLQLIGDLNKDKSTELRERINELEDTKVLLEKQSRKLREQIRYTDGLLEQAVVENAELVEKLRQKGLSEKEFRKQLKKEQQINVEDDTVQRLQTALENAKRELDIIHRTRSPTPSLSEEFKAVSSNVPNIVISQADGSPIPGGVQSKYNINEAILTEEEFALELIGKIKNILSNAKKTGSRGYTEDTKARKLKELTQFESEFEGLDKTAVSDNIIEEFGTLLPAARKILEYRSSLSQPPSSQQTPSLVSPLPLAEKVSGQDQVVKMPVLSEITKIVNTTVPCFFGTEGPDVSSEVFRYIQGCKMVERELITAENNALIQDVIECLKLRLMGTAYSKISQMNFGSVDALCNAVKKHFLKRRNLDQIRELIINGKQSAKEPASKFGERLGSLLKEAIDAIGSEWPEGTGRNTMMADFKRIAVKSFIKGLRDQALKIRFIGQEKNELESLISLVEEAEELFGEGQHAINTISSATLCSFCSEQGHERANCKKRLNTPYCINCGIYGHEVGPMCENGSSRKVTCEHCRKRGHTIEICRQRLASLYCRVCQTTGHKENQFCGQRQSNYQNQWRNSRPINTGIPPDRNFEKRSDNEMEKNGNRNGTRRCYRCGQPGHFAVACRSNSAQQNAN